MIEKELNLLDNEDTEKFVDLIEKSLMTDDKFIVEIVGSSNYLTENESEPCTMDLWNEVEVKKVLDRLMNSSYISSFDENYRRNKQVDEYRKLDYYYESTYSIITKPLSAIEVIHFFEEFFYYSYTPGYKYDMIFFSYSSDSAVNNSYYKATIKKVKE